MKSKSILYVNNLSKSFNQNTVFSNINFEVSGSEILFLMGKNGIGKSTMLKIIAGIVLQDAGSITFNNSSSFQDELGYLSTNDRSFFNRLTAYENITYFSTMRGIPFHSIKAKIKDFSEKLSISEKILGSKFMKLSTGQKKKISIIRALIHDPKLILLDEPTESLDLSTKESFYHFLLNNEFLNESKICIYASHRIDECKKLASKCLLLENNSYTLFERSDFSDIEFKRLMK